MTTEINSMGFAKAPEDTRIVVAMSGGVDSSVAAGILAKQGYDVIGITLQLYDHGAAIQRAGSCCAGQDIEDAQRVAEVLGIPHYVLDYEKRFRDAVINPFMDAYIAGETPVPCISCNQTVKFADLLATAKDLGADALATGHYIRSGDNGAHRAMFRPVDHERDQSYFLFATTQEQLDYIRFPLGDLPKSDVRKLAEDMGLVVAQKQDSQDICFVPQGRYSDVVAKLRPGMGRKGAIMHLDGRVLGEHEGILNFTIGQRRGIGVATGEPLFVLYIDARTDCVIVGPREALDTKKIILRDLNWLGDDNLSDIPASGLDIFAKVRSTRPPAPMILYRDSTTGEISVSLLEAEEGIASGQACVFYSSMGNDARVLGGGFVQASHRATGVESQIADILATVRQTAQVKSIA